MVASGIYIGQEVGKECEERMMGRWCDGVVLEVEGRWKSWARKPTSLPPSGALPPGKKALGGSCFQESNPTSLKHLFLTMSVSGFIFTQC